MRTIWIVKGEVTNVEAYSNATLGQAEYQFSDGPPGHRMVSADYIDLEKGLADHSGCVIHWVEETANPQE